MDWTTITDQLLLPAAIVAVWFVLMRFILPRLGIST
jgi:hypothetical protein